MVGLALLGGPLLLVFLDRFVPLVSVILILILILLSRRMELLELLDGVGVPLEHLSVHEVVGIIIRPAGRRDRTIFPQWGTAQSFTTARVASSIVLTQAGVTGDSLFTSHFFNFLCTSDLKSIIK